MGHAFKVIFILMLSLFMNTNSHAHHSFAATFKVGEKIQVTGVVTRFSFKNPHVNIYFDVKNPDGTVTNWVSESGAATNMRRSGWSRDSLKAGDIVQIDGDATHDGSPMIAVDNVALLNEDGSVAQVMGQDEGDQGFAGTATTGGMGMGPREVVKAPVVDLTLDDGRPNLTGVWTGYGAPYPSPRDPALPFTDAGRALNDLFDEANDPQVFCDDPGLIRQAGMTPHPLRITQFDDRVEFEYEEYGGKKVIYFDETKGQIGIPTHLGDSVARYDGDTLVVETKNLLPDLATAEGNRLTGDATVTQYYSRVDEDQYGSMIMIKTVTKDPHYLAEEFILENTKMATMEEEFIEVECTPPLRERIEVHAATSFFVTSVGIANLTDIAAADAHCETLASTLDQGGKNWRAYLGGTAQQRIGNGPWYNAEGTPIAKTVADLDLDSIIARDHVTERATEVIRRDDDGLFYCFAAGDYYQVVDLSK